MVSISHACVGEERRRAFDLPWEPLLDSTVLALFYGWGATLNLLARICDKFNRKMHYLVCKAPDMLVDLSNA